MEETHKTKSGIRKEQLIEYKNNKDTLNSLKDELRKKKDEFEENNIELINKIYEINTQISLERGSITKCALLDYEATKNKQLLGGISIRRNEILTYKDTDALNWARTNMPIVIKEVIDIKTFEVFAKTRDLDFVNKEDKFTVCFPKEIKLDKVKE